MPRGIKYCYWRTNNGQLYRVEKGKTYRLHTGDLNEFVVDEHCMEEGTVNKKTSANASRWAFIYNGFFKDVENIESGDSPLWGSLGTGTEPVKKWGIGTKYKTGSTLTFAPSGYNFYYGFVQRVELFSFTPGSGFYFYVIPIAKSSIGFAYFKDSEKVRRYGESINLLLFLHGYNLEENHSYKIKVYLLEMETAVGLGETREFEKNNLWKEPKFFILKKGASSTDDYNCRFSFDFPIDIEWKKNENKQKNFTVAVEIYKADNQQLERVAYRNFATEPTKDLVQYDKSVLKIEDLDHKESVSSRFMVSEELMDHYLQRTEQTKINQIQYIGDIRYTRKEFDPCGFSTITVKDDKQELIIFDENATDKPIDRTAQTFDVIAGDEQKSISVKVGNLTTKGVLCNGLLLETGQKHSDRKNLFQIDKVMPALRPQGGVYVTSPDLAQKDDTDVSPDKQKGYSEDVSEIQEWLLNRDYKFNGEDEIVLMLRYVYNKTFQEQLQRKVTTEAMPAANTLWLFNYFWLSQDKLQSYYLPVSTCRYPNQIVKIRVFPDMEWELAALIAVPLWKKTTFKFKSTRENLSGYHNNFNFRYVRRELDAKVEQEAKVGVDFTAKAVTSGKEYEAGYKIEKSIKKVATIFNSVYNGLEVFHDTDDNLERSAAYRTGAVSKFEFNIDPPNVAIALKWKHELAKLEKNLGKVGTRIEGGVALKPFIGIGITVDLISVLGKVGGAVGKAVEWIIEALEYAIEDIDIYFNFKLVAEITGEISIGYHNLDGWDAKLKRQLLVTVNATIEAGVDYEGTVIGTFTRLDTTYETVETFKAKASMGCGVEYKEDWDADSKGIFKTVTVTFTGAKAELEVYSAVVRRKKTVHNPDWEETDSKKVDVKAKKEFPLLDKSEWYKPTKIYTDDENED